MTLSTKESPVRALRLPEISRDAIVRGLSEIQVPDLSKIERPSIEMPEIDLSKVELPRVDVGKAVADAAVAMGIARRSRPRWPFLLGAAVIAGLTAWALMHSASVRDRLSGASRTARQRFDEMRRVGASLDRPYDVASALEEAGVTANEYLDGLDATTDTMAAAEQGTPAFEAAEARV
jgi:hypothetical protein